jgi:coenzyme PQQ precursor peptide PqqA
MTSRLLPKTDRLAEVARSRTPPLAVGPDLIRLQAYNGRKEMRMDWTTPTLVEICIGLEINGYLPAEF